MNAITSLLAKQTIDTQEWVDKIIIDFPLEKWFEVPEAIGSSLAWQLGHIMVSQFYYTVVLIKGFDPAFAEKINLKKYSNLFAKGVNMGAVAQETTSEELLHNWRALQLLSVQTIKMLKEDELQADIVPHKPHPFVRSKQDSIEWNSRHNMWHCGQIGVIRRMLGKPYDFGF